jgi:hypothetical protein
MHVTLQTRVNERNDHGCHQWREKDRGGMSWQLVERGPEDRGGEGGVVECDWAGEKKGEATPG